MLGAAFCTLQMIPLAITQWLAALIFGPARTLQWACYFHALAVAPRYAQQLVGRILGYNNVAIALLSDTLPYGLTAFVAGAGAELDGQAWRYACVRVVLVLPVLGASVNLYRVLSREERQRSAASEPHGIEIASEPQIIE